MTLLSFKNTAIIPTLTMQNFSQFSFKDKPIKGYWIALLIKMEGEIQDVWQMNLNVHREGISLYYREIKDVEEARWEYS